MGCERLERLRDPSGSTGEMEMVMCLREIVLCEMASCPAAMVSMKKIAGFEVSRTFCLGSAKEVCLAWS